MGCLCFADSWFFMDQDLGSWWRKRFSIVIKCAEDLIIDGELGLIIDPLSRFRVIKACVIIPVFQRWSGKFLLFLHNLGKRGFLKVRISLSTEFH